MTQHTSPKLRQGDPSTQMTRKMLKTTKKIPVVGKLLPTDTINDFIFKNECNGKDRVLTYEYLPEITMLTLEQLLYITIFIAYLVELLSILTLFVKGKVTSEEMKNYLSIQSAKIVLAASIFFVISFRIIPIMTQSCRAEWKIAVVRVLNVAIVYLFYKNLVQSMKEKFESFFTDKKNKFAKVLTDPKYIELKETLIKTSYPTIYNLACNGNEVNPALANLLKDPQIFTVGSDKESQTYKDVLNFCQSP